MGILNTKYVPTTTTKNKSQSIKEELKPYTTSNF